MPENGAAISFLISFFLVRCSMSRDDFDIASSFGGHWVLSISLEGDEMVHDGLGIVGHNLIEF